MAVISAQGKPLQMSTTKIDASEFFFLYKYLYLKNTDYIIFLYVFALISGSIATFFYNSVDTFGRTRDSFINYCAIKSQERVLYSFRILLDGFVCYFLFFSLASFVSFRFIRWKKFSIGFKSGLRGGIGNSLAPILLRAFLATALFWLGSPSWMKIRLCERLAWRKMSLK